MSNLSPDFVLPENFCANPQEAWTIPARFYTDQNAFEHRGIPPVSQYYDSRYYNQLLIPNLP